MSWTIPLTRKWPDKEFLAARPIFDEYESVAINFPAYNWRIPGRVEEVDIMRAVGNPERGESVQTRPTQRREYLQPPARSPQ